MMSYAMKFNLCRLCLCRGGSLFDICGESGNFDFVVEETIQDLLHVRVTKEASVPWNVCRNCLEKLSDFQQFKRRCAECLETFEGRLYEDQWSRNSKHEGRSEENDVLPVDTSAVSATSPIGANDSVGIDSTDHGGGGGTCHQLWPHHVPHRDADNASDGKGEDAIGSGNVDSHEGKGKATQERKSSMELFGGFESAETRQRDPMSALVTSEGKPLLVDECEEKPVGLAASKDFPREMCSRLRPKISSPTHHVTLSHCVESIPRNELRRISSPQNTLSTVTSFGADGQDSVRSFTMAVDHCGESSYQGPTEPWEKGLTVKLEEVPETSPSMNTVETVVQDVDEVCARINDHSSQYRLQSLTIVPPVPFGSPVKVEQEKEDCPETTVFMDAIVGTAVHNDYGRRSAISGKFEFQGGMSYSTRPEGKPLSVKQEECHRSTPLTSVIVDPVIRDRRGDHCCECESLGQASVLAEPVEKSRMIKLEQEEDRGISHVTKCLQCKICSRSFQQLIHLNQHMQSVHSVGIDARRKRGVRCLTWKTAGSVARDGNSGVTVEKCHRNKLVSEGPALPAVKPREKPARSKPKTYYPCKICPRRYRLLTNLHDHLISWHGCSGAVHVNLGPKRSCNVGTHKCLECEKRFLNGERLKHHMLIHRKDKTLFECDLCNRTYTTQFNLQYHVRTNHLKLKKFACRECDFRSVHKGSLNRHILLVHSAPTNATPSGGDALA